MLTLLAEQPVVLSLMLAVLAVALIYGWLQTASKQLAAAGLIAAALIPIVWIIAGAWVTEREQIETLIYQTADAIKRNDHRQTLDLIADPATRDQARQELEMWVFDEAKVTKIRDIELIDQSYPLEADIDLTVKVVVSQTSGPMQDVTVPRRLLLRLQKQGDHWQIVDYSHLPIVGGPDEFTPGLRR